MVKEQGSSSKTGEQSKSHGFKFPCCSSENMAQMMKKFCVGKDGDFDICAMMEKMCAMDREEPDQE
jgi:hypothetical protein